MKHTSLQVCFWFLWLRFKGKKNMFKWFSASKRLTTNFNFGCPSSKFLNGRWLLLIPDTSLTWTTFRLEFNFSQIQIVTLLLEETEQEES